MWRESGLAGLGEEPSVSSPGQIGKGLSLGVRVERFQSLVKRPGQLTPYSIDNNGLLLVGSGEIFSATSNGTAITASGSTSLIAAPSAGLLYLIRYLQAINNGGATVTVSWHTGKDARRRYRRVLANGGEFFRDYGSSFWAIADSDLNIHLSGGSSVEWHVDYQLVSINQ